jgi:multiple sugar transport system permease protein
MSTKTTRRIPEIKRNVAPRRRFLGLEPGTFWLVLPALIPVLVLSIYPLLTGIYFGFTDVEAGQVGQTNFVWLENFQRLLSDGYFWNSFKVGTIWGVGVTALQFATSLGLAILLNQRLRFRGFIRTLAIIPWAMPPVVIGFTWKLLYHPNAGVLNEVLQGSGMTSENINWLGDPSLALPAVIVVGVWAGMPQTTIILLAGLQSVPDELHEAAALDGASAWMGFRVVTWPSIKPVVYAITSLDFIWNFNSFGLVYILTEGGPAGSTKLPMLFAYEEAFRYGNYGYAAALGNAMVLIIAIPVVLYLRKQIKAAD